GFPTKLGEYLATGIPTICTKVGDIEKYLEHDVNSYLILPDNPKQLSEAIINRYKYYDKFNEIGQMGKNVAAENFDYRLHIPKLQKILDDAVLSSYSS
ncbi:MAG: glycosyltransferase, partial [Bacteroidia bacterium]|nr:glycosyltransferase [Bacteroidia bacterium]